MTDSPQLLGLKVVTLCFLQFETLKIELKSHMYTACYTPKGRFSCFKYAKQEVEKNKLVQIVLVKYVKIRMPYIILITD